MITNTAELLRKSLWLDIVSEFERPFDENKPAADASLQGSHHDSFVFNDTRFWKLKGINMCRNQVTNHYTHLYTYLK